MCALIWENFCVNFLSVKSSHLIIFVGCGQSTKLKCAKRSLEVNICVSIIFVVGLSNRHMLTTKVVKMLTFKCCTDTGEKLFASNCSSLPVGLGLE